MQEVALLKENRGVDAETVAKAILLDNLCLGKNIPKSMINALMAQLWGIREDLNLKLIPLFYPKHNQTLFLDAFVILLKTKTLPEEIPEILRVCQCTWPNSTFYELTLKLSV